MRRYIRDVSGWEGADWFAGPGATPELGELSWGRHPSWFGLWAAEHAACREGVVLIDMSFMSKFLVLGRDAGRVLDRLATARIDGEPGEIHYTQLLSERGTLLADLTVTKLPDPTGTAHSVPNPSTSLHNKRSTRLMPS